MGRKYLCLAIMMCSAPFVLAQTASAPVKNPDALTALAASLNAMSPSGVINDMSYSATIARSQGSESVSGSATLLGDSSGRARWSYSISNEQHSEVVNPYADGRAAWSGSDGVWHQSSPHNTWTPGVWFAPVLLLESVLNDPQVALQNAGATSLDGQAVQHFRCWRVLPSSSGSAASRAFIQASSVVDIYIDAATALPVALRFNLHPDSNAGVNIPVDVRFLDWQLSSGALIPFEVRRFMNGTLLEDLSVSAVSINSSIPESSFNVPMVAGGAQ